MVTLDEYLNTLHRKVVENEVAQEIRKNKWKEKGGKMG
jgi:hypothetical protein